MIIAIGILGTIIVISLCVYDFCSLYPKDKEVLDLTNISLNLGLEEKKINYEVAITNSAIKHADMTLYFAFLDDMPTNDPVTAITEVKNAKYKWIEPYKIGVPGSKLVSKDYTEALADYAPDCYAVAIIELHYKAESWFFTAGPKYEMGIRPLHVV